MDRVLGLVELYPTGPKLHIYSFYTFFLDASDWTSGSQFKITVRGARGERNVFQDDIHKWKKSEKLVIEAACHIQLFFGIQGNAPPTPSTFHYDHSHKSHAVAKHRISVSRDWFVIWMGFLSYLISRIVLLRPSAHAHLPPHPLQRWYNLLRNDGYPDRKSVV